MKAPLIQFLILLLPFTACFGIEQTGPHLFASDVVSNSSKPIALNLTDKLISEYFLKNYKPVIYKEKIDLQFLIRDSLTRQGISIQKDYEKKKYTIRKNVNSYLKLFLEGNKISHVRINNYTTLGGFEICY